MGWTFYYSSGEALTNFGPTALTDLDIDGGSDIGAAIVDADLFIVDDGAGGTNRKTAASRLKTYGSVVTREGGNLTEGTSTSTSPADILGNASLSIGAIEPGRVIFAGRKTSGAVADGSAGVKINNSVVISVPATSSTTHFAWGSADTNEAQNGPGGFHIAPRVTNYLNSSAGAGVCGYAPVGGGQSSTMTGVQLNDDAGYPNAEIDDITLQVIVQSSSITIGLDELHVYSLVSS